VLSSARFERLGLYHPALPSASASNGQRTTD